jgi:hypothetical protein
MLRDAEKRCGQFLRAAVVMWSSERPRCCARVALFRAAFHQEESDNSGSGHRLEPEAKKC